MNHSEAGASHVAGGVECQDSSLSWRSPDGRHAILAVADGHGGERYVNSARGAATACQVALGVLREFCSQPEPRLIPNVVRSIVAQWVGRLRGDGPIETFGCTLIAYAQTPTCWLGLQIGDGRFVTLCQDRKWRQPIKWDDRCFLNETTSMCDADAATEFRTVFVRTATPPAAVFLCSDGIDMTFGHGRQLYRFYRHILNSIAEEGEDEVRRQMPEVLWHYSAVGSRDDMTLALCRN